MGTWGYNHISRENFVKNKQTAKQTKLVGRNHQAHQLHQLEMFWKCQLRSDVPGPGRKWSDQWWSDQWVISPTYPRHPDTKREDRCLNPQTSPFWRSLKVPFTPTHQVFGGFWMSRVINGVYSGCNLLASLLLTSWDILVGFQANTSWGERCYDTSSLPWFFGSLEIVECQVASCFEALFEVSLSCESKGTPPMPPTPEDKALLGYY